MKRLIPALAITALLLAGCAPPEDNSRELGEVFTKVMPDGTTVECIWVKRGYGGGLSCDWNNRKASQ